MAIAPSEATEVFRWDLFRDTSVGRYLWGHEWRFIQVALASVIVPGMVLDLGCGSGRLTVPLSQQGFDTIGLEPDPVALRSFRRACGSVPLVRASGIELPFAGETFRAITALQVIDYLPLRRFVHECHRVLADGGLLIFDALNRTSYKGVLKRATSRTLDLPSGNVSMREVVNTLEQAGFQIHTVQGYNWLPFSRHSNSPLVPAAATLETFLRLNHLPAYSPKVLISAQKRSARSCAA